MDAAAEIKRIKRIQIIMFAAQIFLAYNIYRLATRK